MSVGLEMHIGGGVNRDTPRKGLSELLRGYPQGSCCNTRGLYVAPLRRYAYLLVMLHII